MINDGPIPMCNLIAGYNKNTFFLPKNVKKINPFYYLIGLFNLLFFFQIKSYQNCTTQWKCVFQKTKVNLKQ